MTKPWRESLAKKTHDNKLNCTYKIGKDLEIWIKGIGLPDTGVTFAKSNFEGVFYAPLGMRHLCVVVSGRFLMQGVAFISPKNGKVYKAGDM